MIKQCQAQLEAKLLDYLAAEPVYNTFLIADIINYGFENEFQKIYGDFDDDQNIHAVYLKFYDNLIVYSKEGKLDQNFLTNWFSEWQPTVVMGKDELIMEICSLLSMYKYHKKPLYLLKEENLKEPEKSIFEIQKAKPADSERIYNFLMTIEEFKTLYSSSEMIENRLKTGDGEHYFIEKDGKIIGQANSAADNPYTVMIGGVGTAPKERGQGIGAQLVTILVKGIFKENKVPCLFCKEEEEHNLYVDLGFAKVGNWAVLERGYDEP